ncbi:MAG: choice-of-anchor L domain-containing protein [Acidimicrobiales bacterium]
MNPDHFRDNSFSSPPANPINIQSDGLSVELICSAPVNAGQTNHMKLAIADTSDQILDSVVMIKAGSLSVTPPESCNDHDDNDGDSLVDMEDDDCQSSTTPAPVGSTGVGSNNNPPPFTGNEGTPVLLDASALGWIPTEHTVTTSWTVTGINGTVGTCTVSPAGKLPLNPDHTAKVVTALCPVEGEYVARIDGWDIEGGSDWDTDVDFFVHNAPPSVSIGSPSTGTEVAVGDPVDVSAGIGGDVADCEIHWGDGSTDAGDVAGGECTGTHTYDAPGSMVVSVTATDTSDDSSADAVVIDVVDSAPLPVAHPSIGGVWEGDAGTTTVDVPVTLSAPSSEPVTLDYQTVDTGGQGIASSASDYEATSGTVTFDPGETTAHVTVTVNGDTTHEPPALYGEWIVVAFSNPTGATLDTSFFGVGVGLILDDDPIPTIHPGAGAVFEGNSGDTTVDVPVTLSNPSAEPRDRPLRHGRLDPGGRGELRQRLRRGVGRTHLRPGRDHEARHHHRPRRHGEGATAALRRVDPGGVLEPRRPRPRST